MTVEIERDALLGAVRAVVGVVSTRNTLPVLGNLLVEVADGTLTITGTDLDLQASGTAAASGEVRTTVDAQKLLGAAQSFRTGKVTLTIKDGRSLLVKQGRGQRTLPILPAEDFPRMTADADTPSFGVPVGWLSRLIEAPALAQDKNGPKDILKGVFLHHRDGALLSVATDGYKLVRAEMPAPLGADQLPDIILPSKTVALLSGVMKSFEGEVRIAATGRLVTFVLGRVTILSKVLDGTFPAYQHIIPAKSEPRFTVMRDALREAVSAVAAVVSAEETSKARHITFELAEDGEHEVTAKDKSGTLSVEPLDADGAKDDFAFTVNGQWLTSIAGIFSESGRLSVAIAAPESPMLITSDKDPDLVAVIKPLGV